MWTDGIVGVMNRFVSSVVLATAVVAGTMAAGHRANASTYDFSYTFGPGEFVSGSFVGTASGGLITDLTDIQASYNGVAFTGPLEALAYVPTSPNCGADSCFKTTGATASLTNVSDDNFVFTNTPLLSTSSNWFYVIQPWNNGPANSIATQYYKGGSQTDPSNFVNYFNGDFVAQSLSITATPLPSTWTMLIAGFAGLIFFASRVPNKRAFAALAAA
jgi:hypothetical protein